MTANIAVVGQFGAGKTTLAKALVAHGYTKHSWADPVKEIASWAYGPIDKEAIYLVGRNGVDTPVTGRQILQRIGTDALRDQVDQDFWIKAGVQRIKAAAGPLVNDDTRFPNEVKALRDLHWLIVRLAVPDEIRMQRYEALYGRRPTSFELNHPSETEVAKIEADFEVSGLLPVEEIVRQVGVAVPV